MEYTARFSPAAVRPRRLVSRAEPAALSAWTLAFAMVTYLAMRNGGYDTIVRSEVGLAVWWIVLLAAVMGLIGSGIGRGGWIAIALLGGFAAWTGIAATWSVSPGDTITEFGREATYLGFLVLAIALQGRAGARHTLNGLTCAFGLVTVLAVLSRLHPGAFPANPQLQFLGAGSARRLSYPLNYWNALAAFAAIGVPLLVTVALTARTVVARSLAAAVLPISALCIYLSISRGGVLELGVGVAVLLALVPRRLQALGTVLAGAAGAAVLIAGAADHPAVRSGQISAGALHQGNEMLVLVLVACAGAGLLQAAMATAEIHLTTPRWLAPDRAITARTAVVLAVAAGIVALAAGLPDRLSHVWQQFTAPTGVVVPVNDSTVFSRLSALNGNGRYQYWQAALHAAATQPLNGVGPGTFQYWWAQHATTDGPVINAHSLYLETLAETGIVGLVLIVGLLVLFLGAGVRRSLSPDLPAASRVRVAGATAAFATFAAAAALEWVWQMAALAAAALVLGAVLIAGRDERVIVRQGVARTERRPSLMLAGLAIAALVFIAVPLAATVEISDSQSAALAGHLRAAYDDSLTAERIEPYAAAPRLQEALVLEASDDLNAAAVAAAAATRKAPTDWQAWLTLARIDARRGAESSGVAALHRAELLDPRNSLWQGQL